MTAMQLERAESGMNQVVNQRMGKRQLMRWSLERANLLLEVRCAMPEICQLEEVEKLRDKLAPAEPHECGTLAGFGPDTVCESGDGGTPLTVAQLADSVKQCESEESRIRELVAQVDARNLQATITGPPFCFGTAPRYRDRQTYESCKVLFCTTEPVKRNSQVEGNCRHPG